MKKYKITRPGGKVCTFLYIYLWINSSGEQNNKPCREISNRKVFPLKILGGKSVAYLMFIYLIQ